MISVFQASSYVGCFAYKPVTHTHAHTHTHTHTHTLATIDRYLCLPLVLLSQFRGHLLSENYPETFMLKEEALQMYSHLLTSI